MFQSGIRKPAFSEGATEYRSKSRMARKCAWKVKAIPMVGEAV
jgi:hypothetical protein